MDVVQTRDLTYVVDRHGLTGLAPNAEVPYCTVFPEEGSVISRGVPDPSDDLAGLVNVRRHRAHVGVAQISEVRHHAVVPKQASGTYATAARAPPDAPTDDIARL